MPHSEAKMTQSSCRKVYKEISHGDIRQVNIPFLEDLYHREMQKNIENLREEMLRQLSPNPVPEIKRQIEKCISG